MKKGNLLREKMRDTQSADPDFGRAHRSVQMIMAAWAAIVILDRAIGLATQAYEPTQLPYAVLGGALLVFVAYLGTRGHVQGAMMVMQINMAVFLIQFVSTCFFYREAANLRAIIFYGISAGILVAGSLALFLNRNLEAYRAKIRRLKGKQEKPPRVYRTNSRLVRNRKS